ncbi:hypothetical protein ACN28I_33670 [Archangium gephyra]|uniref:hypothetical protein n=1 Tax=Archangium gephyra TaxID=48 RepID=UPI003B7DCFFC
MKKTEDGGTAPGDEQPPMVAGGADKRWPRRRLLRWALGLLPVAAGGGWAALDWLGEREASTGEERPSPRTTWICFAGHRGAYLELDNSLQPPILKPNAPARLMRACLYLEHGSLDAMRRDLIWPEVEHTLEARLLLELLRAALPVHGLAACLLRVLGRPRAPGFQPEPAAARAAGGHPCARIHP